MDNGRMTIGYTGQFNARPISIPVAHYLEKWPGTVPQLWYIRPTESESDSYPVTGSVNDNGLFVWVPNAADTAIEGEGTLQFAFSNPAGTILGFSPIMTVTVLHTMEHGEDTPDGITVWVSSINAAAATTVSNAAAAAGSASAANTSATNAAASASAAAASAATASAAAAQVSTKQDKINDLDSIRAGAALGATALQTHQDISGKQDVIADLSTIRAGAALGATALQEHQSLEGYAEYADLATVAKTGSYDDLTDTPTIPAAYDDSEIRQDIVNLQNDNASLTNRVEDAENAVFKRQTVTETGAQTVPQRSVRNADVVEIGGNTVVQDGALVSADVSAVKSIGANLFNAHAINMSNITVNDDGSVTLPAGYNFDTKTKLRAICPNLKAGKTYYLYADVEPNNNAHATYIYLYGLRQTWVFGLAKTITEEALDGNVYLYNSGSSTNPDSVVRTIRYIITEASTKPTYTPYRAPISYTIPSAVRSAYPLRSAGTVHDSYSFDGEKWWHTKRIGDTPTNNAYPVLDTPIVTDITALMNWDGVVSVESGGTVEAVSDVPAVLGVLYMVGYDLDSMVTGVKVAGTALTPTDGVVDVPVATQNGTGLAKYRPLAYGLQVDSNGVSIARAQNSEIDSRASNYYPIVPRSLPYAVKSAMSAATSTTDPAWTDAEKQAACQRMGAEREPKWELIESFTVQNNDVWTRTSDPQGNMYNLRFVYVIRELPAGTDISSSTGYGRIRIKDASGNILTSECGRFTGNSLKHLNSSLLERSGNLAMFRFTRTYNAGDCPPLCMKPFAGNEGGGISLDFGNVVSVESLDKELIGVKIKIYGVRA